MKTFAITGATGLVGFLLHKKLVSEKQNVIVLTRDLSKIRENITGTKYLRWDTYDNSLWKNVMNEADVVVHLAGTPIIEKRWTEERKKTIYESRVKSTQVIVDAIACSEKKPELLIVSSGVNYYGSNWEEIFTEESHAGNDFMANLAIDWENAAAEVEKFGVRRVSLRTGMVLSSRGGALPKFQLPFKLFVGGIIGSGKQFIPWIHEEDFIDIIMFAVSKRKLNGAVNAVSPQSVRMNEFCKTLGKVMKRKSWTKAPEFLVKLVLGEVSSLLLEGQNVYPKKLLDAGFKFGYSDLEDALRSIINSE